MLFVCECVWCLCVNPSYRGVGGVLGGTRIGGPGYADDFRPVSPV